MKGAHHKSMSDKIKKGLTDKGITPRSIVAFVIFGMIVLVFILTDLTGRHQSSGAMGSAAEVNGELISLKDFQDEENRLGQYYSQLFGGQMDSDMQRNMLRGEALRSLVTKSAAAQAAEKEGIYATDAEVRHMIMEDLPYFKRDGVFQSDAYKAILQANRMSPGEFESKLRQDIKNQRSRDLFETSLTSTELQKSFEKQLHAAKMDLEFIQLSAADFAKANPVTTAEAEKALSQPDFKKRVQDEFNSNKSKYETPEQVRASHILIKADAQNDEAAHKKAEAVLARLKKEDFGKVAAQVSDDPGSKAKNGDLGYFTRGKMVKEFENAAFSLPVGKVSDLVKSAFGYHIIKVTDKKSFVAADFDKAKVGIAENMLAQDKYLDFVKKVEADLSQGKTDEAVAQLTAAHMNWKDTGYFDLSSEVAPVMNSAQAIKVALELNKAQPVAKKLVREGDVQFLVKLKDVKTTDGADLKAQDESALEKQKAMEAYAGWVDDFKKTAKIQTNSSLLSQ